MSPLVDASNAPISAAADIVPPSRAITQAKTSVTAKSGECKVIGALWNEGADGVSATIVLLVPRLVTAAKKE